MLCFGYSIEFRGKGLGKETLEFIKIVAKAHGVCTLLLEVDKTKFKAQNLYGSHLNFKR
jgi:ribosomal protein S18 acetylase RimI-like enzyme